MTNRDRAEIIALVLQGCTEPSTRSKIMYSALLNFHQVAYYCDTLVRNGLLSAGAQKNTYIITKKGRRYLGLYNDMWKLVTPNHKDRLQEIEASKAVNLAA